MGQEDVHAEVQFVRSSKCSYVEVIKINLNNNKDFFKDLVDKLCENILII